MMYTCMYIEQPSQFLFDFHQPACVLLHPLLSPLLPRPSLQAYSVALKLFDFACSLSRKGDEGGVAPMAGELLDVPLPAPHEASLLAMLYPPDSHPDDNPVFLLCRNDTCSFTWTGEEHVHQDIFECRTCGLIGTLCCCTECAYTCHRGHDCGFKKASPTAYCDCWERCKCRALAPGATGARQSLLLRLLKQTPLGSKVNARGEHLLGALLTTVARQSREQSAWHGLRSASSYRQRPKQEDMPAHDLAPPTFAPKALSIVLEDWPCTEAAVMGGATAVPGEHSQTSTLDNLTHTLLAKHSQEVGGALRVAGGRDTSGLVVCGPETRLVSLIFLLPFSSSLPPLPPSLDARLSADGPGQAHGPSA